MTKPVLRVAGTFLALIASASSTMAFAQVQDLSAPLPGAVSPAQASATVPAATRVRLDPNEPSVMVTRSELTGGLRAPRQGDNDVGIMPISSFRAAGGTDDEFAMISDENARACERSGGYILRATQQAATARELGGEWTTIREDLVDMGNQLNRASRIRTGSNVISTGLLCALSLGYYCGAAVLGGIGNEVTGRAHTRQSQLNVRQSDLNARQSQLNIDQMILFTDGMIGWSIMINDYCTTWQSDAIIAGANGT